MKNKLEIIDNNDKILAVRKTACVEILPNENEVKMHELYYSFDDIIAIANKIKAIKDLKFS